MIFPVLGESLSDDLEVNPSSELPNLDWTTSVEALVSKNGE